MYKASHYRAALREKLLEKEIFALCVLLQLPPTHEHQQARISKYCPPVFNLRSISYKTRAAEAQGSHGNCRTYPAISGSAERYHMQEQLPISYDGTSRLQDGKSP